MQNTLLVFDQDGTLTAANTIGDWTTYKQTIALYFQIDPAGISDDLSHYPNITDSGIFRTLMERHHFLFDATSYDQFIAAYSARCCDPLPAEIPGASGLIAKIHAQKHPVAVATGAWQPKAKKRLQVIGTSAAQIPLATAHDHMTRDGIMQSALIRAQSQYSRQFSPDEIVYVGDAVWDALACIKLGWRFVARCEKPEKLAQFGVPADAVIPNYVDHNRFWAAVAAARVPQRV